MPSKPFLALVLASVLFGGATSCVAPIRTERVTPPIPEVRNPPTEESLKDFRKLYRKDPLAATGRILDGLRITSEKIEAGDESAIVAYNYLLGRFVEATNAADIYPWAKPYTLQGRTETYTLTGTCPPDIRGARGELIPADTLVFSGKFAPTRANKPGIGAPCVAVVHQPPTEHEHFDENLRFRNLTAVLRFDGTKVSYDLEDPHSHETTPFGNRHYPLAADFSANVCLFLSRTRIDKYGFARMLDPSKYDDTASLDRIQPYDPDRIPVLLVHGLQDTPATFAPMYLEVMKDPDIRKHYQFWVFSYPSGYPYPYSASLMRNELDRMRRAFPDHKDIVVIGHSMGGLLTRVMVTDAGEKIWTSYFNAPPSQTDIPGKSRDLMEKALVFDARTEIDRVIFMSAPHRGSELASNWIGRLGMKLIKIPSFIADTRDTIANALSADQAAQLLERAPNSISTP